MSNYYQTTLEQVAEWFMQLFFDPMYHVESVIVKNDSMNSIQTEATPATSQELNVSSNLEKTIDYLVADMMELLRCFLSKSISFKKPEVHFIAYLNQLAFENWLSVFRLLRFNITLQQI